MTLNLSRRDLLVLAPMTTVPGLVLAENSLDESRTSVPAEAGSLPNNEKKINIITLRDLEAEAQKVMAPFGYAYVSGGAGDEWTMRENLAAFNRWVINGDFMSGNGAADTTTTILGTNISYPAITAPIGNQGSVHAHQRWTQVVPALYSKGSRLREGDAATCKGGRLQGPYCHRRRGCDEQSRTIDAPTRHGLTEFEHGQRSQDAGRQGQRHGYERRHGLE